VGTKQKRFLYPVGFKLNALNYAKGLGNRAHERCLISPPTENSGGSKRSNYRDHRRTL
jgi:hypothetical protein